MRSKWLFFSFALRLLSSGGAHSTLASTQLVRRGNGGSLSQGGENGQQRDDGRMTHVTVHFNNADPQNGQPSGQVPSPDLRPLPVSQTIEDRHLIGTQSRRLFPQARLGSDRRPSARSTDLNKLTIQPIMKPYSPANAPPPLTVNTGVMSKLQTFKAPPKASAPPLIQSRPPRRSNLPSSPPHQLDSFDSSRSRDQGGARSPPAASGRDRNHMSESPEVSSERHESPGLRQNPQQDHLSDDRRIPSPFERPNTVLDRSRSPARQLEGVQSPRNDEQRSRTPSLFRVSNQPERAPSLTGRLFADSSQSQRSGSRLPSNERHSSLYDISNQQDSHHEQSRERTPTPRPQQQQQRTEESTGRASGERSRSHRSRLGARSEERHSFSQHTGIEQAPHNGLQRERTPSAELLPHQSSQSARGSSRHSSQPQQSEHERSTPSHKTSTRKETAREETAQERQERSGSSHSSGRHTERPAEQPQARPPWELSISKGKRRTRKRPGRLEATPPPRKEVRTELAGQRRLRFSVASPRPRSRQQHQTTQTDPQDSIPNQWRLGYSHGSIAGQTRGEAIGEARGEAKGQEHARHRGFLEGSLAGSKTEREAAQQQLAHTALVGAQVGRQQGYTEGQQEGHATGHATGHAEGLAEGLTKGKEQTQGGLWKAYNLGRQHQRQIISAPSGLTEVFQGGYKTGTAHALQAMEKGIERGNPSYRLGVSHGIETHKLHLGQPDAPTLANRMMVIGHKHRLEGTSQLRRSDFYDSPRYRLGNEQGLKAGEDALKHGIHFSAGLVAGEVQAWDRHEGGFPMHEDERALLRGPSGQVPHGGTAGHGGTPDQGGSSGQGGSKQQGPAQGGAAPSGAGRR